MENHTPGKWIKACGISRIDTVITVKDGNEIKIAQTFGFSAIANANAARIVTCVNACAGIADPGKTIPDLLAALERSVRAWSRVKNPTALQEEVLEQSRAAIARAKGE